MWLRYLAWTCLASLVCQTSVTTVAALPRFSNRQATSSSLKAGLGWGGGGNISQFEGHQVGWYYTWSPTSWVVPSPSLEFVPQLWGPKDAPQFPGIVNTTSVVANGWKHVLGMNEPQLEAQANLSPQDTATMWKTYLEPLKSAGVQLGSPAMTSSPASKTWLQDFLTACAGGCTVDFVVLHWYGNVASEFTAFLEDFHNTFQRPVWVTEYGCQNFVTGVQCTYDEIVQFLKITQTYMDQTAWVERYAWFGAMAVLPPEANNLTALMDPAGVINSLGQQYIGPAQGSQPSSTLLPSTTLVSATSTGVSASIPISPSSILISTTPQPSSITSLTHSSTPSTASASATTSPYVIIGRASVTCRLSYLSALFGVLLACGSSLL